MSARRGSVFVALAVALLAAPMAWAAKDAPPDAASPPASATPPDPVPDVAVDSDTQAPRNMRRWDARVRLDDGRYRGFHQAGGNDITRDDIGRSESTRDRIIAENNQIRADHRAHGRDLYP